MHVMLQAIMFWINSLRTLSELWCKFFSLRIGGRAMAWKKPAFPVLANVWDAATGPQNLPPDRQIECQIRYGYHGAIGQGSYRVAGGSTIVTLGVNDLPIILLCDIGTRIFGVTDRQAAPGTGSTIECPPGSKLYYEVVWLDIQARGFPNEHLVAVLRRLMNSSGTWHRAGFDPVNW